MKENEGKAIYPGLRIWGDIPLTMKPTAKLPLQWGQNFFSRRKTCGEAYIKDRGDSGYVSLFSVVRVKIHEERLQQWNRRVHLRYLPSFVLISLSQLKWNLGKWELGNYRLKCQMPPIGKWSNKYWEITWSLSKSEGWWTITSVKSRAVHYALYTQTCLTLWRIVFCNLIHETEIWADIN